VVESDTRFHDTAASSSNDNEYRTLLREAACRVAERVSRLWSFRPRALSTCPLSLERHVDIPRIVALVLLP